MIQDREALQKQVCDQLQLLSLFKSRVADQNTNAVPASQLQSFEIEDTSALQAKIVELNDIIEVRDKEVWKMLIKLSIFATDF